MPMPKEIPKKKFKLHKIDALAIALITVAIVTVLVTVFYHGQPTPSAISTSSTSLLYPLQTSDFQYANSSGCLAQETAGPNKGSTYDHILVKVSNRFNETVQFVNASIYVAYIDFTGFRSVGNAFPLMFEAGPNDTTVWTFPVNFPISGAYFGKPYENTNVTSADFGVIIFIRQYGQVQEVMLTPDLVIDAVSVPKC
jgi:hypothetical protein